MAFNETDPLLAFLELQQELVDAFLARRGDELRWVGGRSYLRPAPGGDDPLLVHDGSWKPRRHGAGVLFEEEGTRLRVDVHDHVDDPEYFDLWRLERHFGSMGRSGAKLLNRLSGMSHGPNREKIATWLARLERQGVIVPSGDGFRLTKPTSESHGQ